MLYLSVVTLGLLLQIGELLLQILYLDVFVSRCLKYLLIDLLLHGLDLPCGSLLLIADPCLKLGLLHLVEVLHLAHL